MTLLRSSMIMMALLPQSPSARLSRLSAPSDSQAARPEPEATAEQAVPCRAGPGRAVPCRAVPCRAVPGRAVPVP